MKKFHLRLQCDLFGLSCNSFSSVFVQRIVDSEAAKVFDLLFEVDLQSENEVCLLWFFTCNAKYLAGVFSVLGT
jgi:hypothetical protein